MLQWQQLQLRPQSLVAHPLPQAMPQVGLDEAMPVMPQILYHHRRRPHQPALPFRLPPLTFRVLARDRLHKHVHSAVHRRVLRAPLQILMRMATKVQRVMKEERTLMWIPLLVLLALGVVEEVEEMQVRHHNLLLLPPALLLLVAAVLLAHRQPGLRLVPDARQEAGVEGLVLVAMMRETTTGAPDSLMPM
jgi:hypothetical protein